MTENNIPKHWQLKKLGDVCKLKNGYAFKSDKYENIGVPVIRISDINGGTVSSQKAVRVKANAEYENYLVENNNILVAMSGATTGKFGVYRSTEKAYQNQRVGKFKILNENILNNEFLFHQINSLKRQIEKDAYGGAQPNISSSKIEQMQLAVPPLPEQQAIVAKIEELLSELENGKQQLLTAQQQLKVYRQSLLKWAFEGRLTNKDVKDGELPKGWKKVQIKEVTSMNPKIPDRENISKQMDVQFLPMKLVEEIINKIHLTEIRKYEDVLKGSYTPFINGDVIFAKVTPCMENGKIAIVDNLKNGIGFGSSEFHVLRAGDKVNNKFILYYLVQDRFRHEAANEMTGAVGLRRVPKQFIENYLIPLPPLKEQQSIVDELESKLTVCDKIEETISQSLLQAETLRQSILKKAFEGKLMKYYEIDNLK